MKNDFWRALAYHSFGGSEKTEHIDKKACRADFFRLKRLYLEDEEGSGPLSELFDEIAGESWGFVYGRKDATDVTMANRRHGRSKDGRVPGPVETYESASAPPKGGKKSDGRRCSTSTNSTRGHREPETAAERMSSTRFST